VGEGERVTKQQLALAAELMAQAADQFANHGCNDLPLDNTDENWSLVTAYEEFNQGKPWSRIADDDKPSRPERGPIYANDSAFMSWFAHLLKKESTQ
jgi:hypothetical protein